jgi:hypothetical protein
MSTFTATAFTLPAAAHASAGHHPTVSRSSAEIPNAQPPGGGSSGGDPALGPRQRLAIALEQNR